MDLRIDPDRHLVMHLTGKKRQGAMIYLVIEACKSRLLGQRLLSCEPLLIPADGMNRTFTLHSNYAGLKGQYLRIPMPSFWCSLS